MSSSSSVSRGAVCCCEESLFILFICLHVCTPTHSLNSDWLSWNFGTRVPRAAGSNYITASQHQQQAEVGSKGRGTGEGARWDMWGCWTKEGGGGRGVQWVFLSCVSLMIQEQLLIWRRFGFFSQVERLQWCLWMVLCSLWLLVKSTQLLIVKLKLTNPFVSMTEL